MLNLFELDNSILKIESERKQAQQTIIFEQPSPFAEDLLFKTLVRLENMPLEDGKKHQIIFLEDAYINSSLEKTGQYEGYPTSYSLVQIFMERYAPQFENTEIRNARFYNVDRIPVESNITVILNKFSPTEDLKVFFNNKNFLNYFSNNNSYQGASFEEVVSTLRYSKALILRPYVLNQVAPKRVSKKYVGVDINSFSNDRKIDIPSYQIDSTHIFLMDFYDNPTSMPEDTKPVKYNNSPMDGSLNLLSALTFNVLNSIFTEGQNLPKSSIVIDTKDGSQVSSGFNLDFNLVDSELFNFYLDSLYTFDVAKNLSDLHLNFTGEYSKELKSSIYKELIKETLNLEIDNTLFAERLNKFNKVYDNRLIIKDTTSVDSETIVKTLVSTLGILNDKKEDVINMLLYTGLDTDILLEKSISLYTSLMLYNEIIFKDFGISVKKHHIGKYFSDSDMVELKKALLKITVNCVYIFLK